MNEKNLHQTWEITLLTPLHIGDGEEMHQNVDFVAGKGGLDVMDMEAVFAALGDNPRALGEIGRADFDLQRFARDYDLTLPSLYSLPIVGKPAVSNVKRFIKDAYGRPYLPGSTLKGAIRTALQAQFDHSHLPEPMPNRYKEYSRAVNNLDGKDPHHDFIRPLTLSDSESVSPGGAMSAREIKFFNLVNGEKASWKDFSSKKNLPKSEETVGVYVECLNPGTVLHVRVELDQFLSRASVHRLAELPASQGVSGFKDLAAAINGHSLEIARAERDFFAKYKPATAHAASAYESIVGGIQDILKQNAPTMILRLAWGSGWRGMTGNWLRGGDLTEVREIKKLGKKGVAIFPKTRRLAMKDGVPCIPLGWVTFTPLEKDRFSRHVSFGVEPALDFSAPKHEAGPAATSAPPSPGKVGEEKVVASPPETETWENVHLKWTPNDDVITATNKNLKATVKGKELIPEKYHGKLIKNKKAVTATVKVAPYGNAFVILEII